MECEVSVLCAEQPATCL